MNGQFTILVTKRDSGWHWGIRTDCWHEYPDNPEIQQPHVYRKGTSKTSDQAFKDAIRWLTGYKTVKMTKDSPTHKAWVIDEGH